MVLKGEHSSLIRGGILQRLDYMFWANLGQEDPSGVSTPLACFQSTFTFLQVEPEELHGKKEHQVIRWILW